MKASQKETSKKPLYVPDFQIDKIDLKDETYQSRLDYNPKRLENLAKSIESEGQLYPILLLKTGDKYQLLDGFCRTKGTKEYSEKQTLEAKIYEGLSKEEAHKIARAANHKRTPLTEEEFAVSVNDSELPAVEKAALLDMNEQDVHHYEYEGKLVGNKQYASYVSVKPESKKNPFERMGFKISPEQRMMEKARKFAEKSHRLSLQQKAFLVYINYFENYYKHDTKEAAYIFTIPNKEGLKQSDFIEVIGLLEVKAKNDGYARNFSHSLNTAINTLVLNLLIRRENLHSFESHEAKYKYYLTDLGKKLVENNLADWKPLLLAHTDYSKIFGTEKYVSNDINDNTEKFYPIEYLTEEEATNRINDYIKNIKIAHPNLQEKIDSIEGNSYLKTQ